MLERAKRVFDPSEGGGTIELSTSASTLLSASNTTTGCYNNTNTTQQYHHNNHHQHNNNITNNSSSSNSSSSSNGSSCSSNNSSNLIVLPNSPSGSSYNSNYTNSNNNNNSSFNNTTARSCGVGSNNNNTNNNSSSSTGNINSNINNNNKKRRIVDQNGSINGDVCGHCRLPEVSPPKDCLLRCRNCTATGHPICLGYSTTLAERCRNQPWTCMDCKLCTVCHMDHLIGMLIFCDSCDSAFHLTCHQPNLTTQPQGNWICCNCTSSTSDYENQLYTPGFPLTPRDSPIPDGDESRGSNGSWGGGLAGMGSIDPSIPNASNWSIEEVETYFQEKGFEAETPVFKEHALDGLALMLLSRQDITDNLGLRLGPAIKLYRQIRILQTRVPNPPLS